MSGSFAGKNSSAVQNERQQLFASMVKLAIGNFFNENLDLFFELVLHSLRHLSFASSFADVRECPTFDSWEVWRNIVQNNDEILVSAHGLLYLSFFLPNSEFSFDQGPEVPREPLGDDSSAVYRIFRIGTRTYLRDMFAYFS